MATVDKEFYSKFTIIAYNKNGSVRSETLEIAPLEPTESNFEVQMFRDEIQIKDTRSRSKSKHLLVSYEILPLDGYMLRPLLKGKSRESVSHYTNRFFEEGYIRLELL